MHFIDYIPWPLVVLILLFSISMIIKFFVLNKKMNNQMKIGGIIMSIGLFGIITEEIVVGVSINVKYINYLEYSFIPGLIGFLILYGGIVKKVDDPEKKRQLRKYFRLLCLVFGFFGLAVIFTLLVKG